MASSLTFLAAIGMAFAQNCNYVIPSEYDMAYAVDFCRTITSFNPNGNATTYKRFVCTGSEGAWSIEEETHSTSDCNDMISSQSIDSPYNYSCDAIGQCEYALVTQYVDETSCSKSSNYSMDAIVANTCMTVLNKATLNGPYGSLEFLCDGNDEVKQNTCSNG